MSTSDWMTTSTILDQLSDPQEHDVWACFVERFRRPVVSFAIRMGHSAADAEDIAQETLATFVEAFRAGRYDRSKGRLNRWLFGIAARVALGKRRSVQRRALAIPLEDVRSDESLTVASQVEAQWDEAWEKSLLQICLDRVKQEVEPTTLRAFELTVQGDKTPADVAREMQIPVKAVYNAKYTVLKRLRAHRVELDGDAPNS